MKVWNATEFDIRFAAAHAGVAIHSDWSGHGIEQDGRALRFRLAVDAKAPRDEDGLLPYQKVSRYGRRIAAVSWDGHREFMTALFERCPDARLKSAIADYHGREDFERKYPWTNEF